MNIKTHLIVIALLVLAAACGGGDKGGENGNVLEVKAKLAEKRKTFEKLRADIAKLEKKLEKLDPSYAKQKLEAKTTLVTTLSVSKEPFTRFVEVRGKVTSDKNVILNAQTQGLVTYIAVQEGQFVGAGQSLVAQENSVLASSLQEVKTQLQLATALFERQDKLWKQKIGTEIQYLQAKNNKESLERKIQTIQTQMALSSITAPFSGVVDEIFVKKGQNVGPMNQILRLVALDQVQVQADVSEAYLGKINKGDQVKIKFPSLGIEKVAAIKTIGQIINPDNRTFRVELQLANPNRVLKPDLQAVLELKDFTKKEALVIPTNLIQRDKAGDFVYVLGKEDGKATAKKVLIKTGGNFKNRTLVESGLKGDEMLIEQGFKDVTSGGLVKVSNNDQPKGTKTDSTDKKVVKVKN
ncbi:efflux RND transporter periplasmic adaptor subunit [uncultured Microscilla sp.]|uniref:efflux RND transporter periplasmic adaptor subunit n=1 Tax=uncultured Microscilla sp. TaxID=432653 RepID=UPI00260AFFBC|nr:efflux RND transporter periplasmic adaptor subunit [uncultured Microscilla sp.]